MKFLIKRIKKRLVRGFYIKAGRNNQGIIVVRGKGGSVRRKLFLIDNKRILKSEGIILKIFWDYRILKFVGLVIYVNGLTSFILLTKSCLLGQKKIGFIQKVKEGFSNILGNYNIGNILSNLELIPGKGIKLAKSNGSLVIKVGELKGYSYIKVQSGQIMKLSNLCIGIKGEMSNMILKKNIIKKAGFNRNLGKRPKVRGVAMNPVDHPHGGGNGKKSVPVVQKSIWGWQTKGLKTVKKKKFKNAIKI